MKGRTLDADPEFLWMWVRDDGRVTHLVVVAFNVGRIRTGRGLLSWWLSAMYIRMGTPTDPSGCRGRPGDRPVGVSGGIRW